MGREDLEAAGREMLARWRARREAAAALPSAAAAGSGGAVSLMAVSEVVPADATYGPHLLAVPVRFEGAPPAMAALIGPVVRCWPAPPQAVDGFAIGELIKVYRAAGARIAERMG